MNNMEIALRKLEEGCTCAAYNGSSLLSSQKRGVAPLLQWLEEGRSLQDYWVADKVIGKGAAFLYLLLNAQKVHARIISRPALELLKENRISVTYDSCVPAIRNRDNTGFCPIESAVLNCTDPEKALILIKEKLKALRA